MATTRGSRRPTAEERRDQVLEAGISVFAEFGYHATKTADIARRAGISQPYIYALFDDKKALFLACLQRSREQIRDAFAASWTPRDTPEETLAVLGRTYRGLLGDTDARRLQMQGYAASADPEIREFMRRGFMEVSDMLRERTGADHATVARFMAAGNLLNLGAVLALPPEYIDMVF
ncbi:TetR/AcrR family transcriptional regulator [Actinomadura madurae]|uniref:TetR/AcrR family transcriptional regulator n=1 Tax=Actinomadura madurae TaxID=1993 RepID=UPI0020272C80|nr:TetR/AcrR family transcriptional regulator [Actinomadura madurae]URN04320.1 TetR/AcrR family transcriptional regulator [Actinomadura madurae]